MRLVRLCVCYFDVLCVDALITVVVLRNNLWFGAFCRLIHRVSVRRGVLDSFRHVLLKSRRVPIPFCVCVGCSVFIVTRSSSPILIFGLCRHLCLVTVRAREQQGLLLARGILAPISRFLRSDFIREYGASLDLRLFAAMGMNGDRASVWDIRF